MAFDRDAAFKYAETHWNVPCDDGMLWLSNEGLSIARERVKHAAPAKDGWEPMFVKGDGTDPEKAVFRRTVSGVTEEKLISPWDGLADCAHYLSRCLTAGGAKIAERGVRELVQTLQSRSDTKTLCERAPRAGAQRVIDSGIFKKGDMVGYFNVDPAGDYGGRQSYTHSTMYVGKLDAAGLGGVTCHTVARFPPHSWVNDSWWLHDGYTYTLIHFSSDDASVKAVGAFLQGWWKHVYGARTEYYYIFADGRARYTLKAPKSNRETLYSGDGSAYWFVDGSKVTFIWRKTGTVETWTPSAEAYDTVVNGGTRGMATRMF